MKKAKTRFRGHCKAPATHTANATAPRFALDSIPPARAKVMPRIKPTRQEAQEALWAAMMKTLADKGPHKGFARLRVEDEGPCSGLYGDGAFARLRMEDALREDPSRVVVQMEQARDGSICGVWVSRIRDGVVVRRSLPVLDGQDPQRVAATLVAEVLKQDGASPDLAAPLSDQDLAPLDQDTLNALHAYAYQMPDGATYDNLRDTLGIDDGHDDFDNLPDEEPPASDAAARIVPLPHDHPAHRPWMDVSEPEGFTEASRWIEAHPWKIPSYKTFDPASEDAQLVWFLTHNADAIREADGRCRFVWEATVRSVRRDAGPWSMAQTLEQMQALLWLPVPLAWSLAPHMLSVVIPWLADSHNTSIAALRRPIEIRCDCVRGSRLELEDLRRAYTEAAKQGLGWTIRTLTMEPVEVCAMRID